MVKGGAVYILTNKNNTTLYTGVTSNLHSSIIALRTRKYAGSFSSRYNTFKLVYFKSFHSIVEAIVREKQIKEGSRKKIEDLINAMNPEWKDLFPEVEQW